MAPDFSQDPHGDHKVALGAQPGMDRITCFIKAVLIVAPDFVFTAEVMCLTKKMVQFGKR